MKKVFGFQPVFDSAGFRFAQDGNTLGTTDKMEELEVSLLTQLPGEDEFFTIKSSTGWSFDSIEELADLLKEIMRLKQGLDAKMATLRPVVASSAEVEQLDAGLIER